MYSIIDTPWNTTAYIPQLKSGGVATVIRYYNLEDSSSLPQKQFQPAEANALAAAGLTMAVVFEQTGGADGKVDDLAPANGSRDATQALKLAAAIGQPHGSAIYFSVDYDYYESADLKTVESYFAAVSETLKGEYRLGVYGSGTVASAVVGAGHADLIWLAGSTGWSGTVQMLATDKWALFQSEMDIDKPLPHDGNTASSAFPNFGQFTLGSGPVS